MKRAPDRIIRYMEQSNAQRQASRLINAGNCRKISGQSTGRYIRIARNRAVLIAAAGIFSLIGLLYVIF